jgi:hypothetical protein
VDFSHVVSMTVYLDDLATQRTSTRCMESIQARSCLRVRPSSKSAREIAKLIAKDITPILSRSRSSPYKSGPPTKQQVRLKQL